MTTNEAPIQRAIEAQERTARASQRLAPTQ